MIRQAGAREVHMRIASPPITGPCYYGIDTPTREELIAANHSVEEIRQQLGVDTLGYLSIQYPTNNHQPVKQDGHEQADVMLINASPAQTEK